MMIWNSLRRKSVNISQTVLIWLTFISLFGRCNAQESGIDFVLIPIATVVVVFTLLALWFSAIICYVKQRSQGVNISPVPSATDAIEHTFNLQITQNRASGPCSQQYQLQNNVSPSARVLYPGPPMNMTTNGLTFEPVFLPEVTLHQGEAPPTYEEAIRMKTVDLLQQEQV